MSYFNHKNLCIYLFCIFCLSRCSTPPTGICGVCRVQPISYNVETIRQESCYNSNKAYSYYSPKPGDESIVKTWNEEFEWRNSTFQGVHFPDLSNYNESELREEIKKATNGSFHQYMLVQTLAGKKMQTKDWVGAIQIYQEFQNLFPNKKEKIKELIQILKEKEISNIQQIPNISDGSADYIPVIEASNKRLYFTSYNRPNGNGGEDILYSDRDVRTGSWSTSKLAQGLNTSTHESMLGVSSDGTKALIFGNYPGGPGRGDIFTSEDSWFFLAGVNRNHYPSR